MIILKLVTNTASFPMSLIHVCISLGKLNVKILEQYSVSSIEYRV